VRGAYPYYFDGMNVMFMVMFGYGYGDYGGVMGTTVKAMLVIMEGAVVTSISELIQVINLIRTNKLLTIKKYISNFSPNNIILCSKNQLRFKLNS
jgi:hypothetical protein